jgi:hypothetical protein
LFSVNTGQARSRTPTISVRAHGVDCGFIGFEPAGRRMFKPSKNFMSHWKSAKPALEWGESGVSAFVKACAGDARKKYWSRESRIQERLFQQMHGGGRSKTGLLRGLQPVLFGGVPVQLALPVRPRGTSGKVGKQKGHSDLVARSREHGRLVVFEIKRPKASPSECMGALEQAVTYAAALDYLMSRGEHRAAYWRLLGSRRDLRHTPKLSAVAFLHAGSGTKFEEELRVKLAELRAANSRNYGVSVMRYSEVGNGLKIVDEFCA